MSTLTERDLDARDCLTLGAGDAVSVVSGTVLAFVVAHDGGRRVPLLQAGEGEVVAGLELPDADLLITGLPGTRIEMGVPVRPEVVEAITQRVCAARQAEATAEAATAGQLALQQTHQQRLVDDALLSLAAAVPGDRPAAANGWDLQHDAAVVDFLARQVGLHPDPLRLRRALTDADVTGRDPINALATAAGVSIRRVELPPGWWRREGPPVLVRQANTDTVAAAVWRRGHYRVWTPDHGVDVVIDAAVADSLKSRGATFDPLLDPTRPTRLRDLLRIGLQGSRHSTALVLGLTVVVAALAAVIPIVTGSLTQTVASQTTSTLLIIGCALAALAVGDLMVRAVRAFALLRIRGRAVAITAAAVWERMLRLPMSWHNRSTVASRMTDANAVDVSSQAVPDASITALLDVASVAGALIGVFTISPPLAVGLIGFLVVRGLVEVALIRRAARLTRDTIDANAESQSLVLQFVSGVNQLRVAGATGRAFARWANVQAVTTAKEVRRRRLTVIQQITGAAWPTIGLAVIFAITTVTSGDVGQLVTAQTALTVATSALAATISAIGALLAARAVMLRAQAVMVSAPESGTGQEVAQLAGAVDLRDVVFRYRPDMPAVLAGVNLSIPAGTHVAIVGPSGCGKSTLLRVLLGLEDPESGIVSFDGRDLTGLDRSSVRRQIGTVMQTPQLLPGTIRDNVNLGRGLTSSQIWEALERADVADDVRAMPMGLSTAVVEGASTISGGQRQRILMARALAGNPRMVLLDEATSALDNISQAAVVANLDQLDITRIVVAHRLSTIEHADLIVVLNHGEVVEQGTFRDLIAAGGAFQDLVRRQRL